MGTEHDGSQHLQHHVKHGYDSRYVQHDGPEYGVQHDGPGQDLGCDWSQPDGSGQDLSDDQPQPDGPTEHDSQHDVQRHVRHDQQPNVLQYDGLQQQAHGTAAAD